MVSMHQALGARNRDRDGALSSMNSISAAKPAVILFSRGGPPFEKVAYVAHGGIQSCKTSSERLCTTIKKTGRRREQTNTVEGMSFISVISESTYTAGTDDVERTLKTSTQGKETLQFGVHGRTVVTS